MILAANLVPSNSTGAGVLTTVMLLGLLVIVLAGYIVVARRHKL
jgi:hypothetical protein